MRISKSKFVSGVQCLKRLYWQVHEPELAAEPDAATEAIIEQGREVGLLARKMFPSGVEVGSNRSLEEAIRATRELVENPEVPAIFEGVQALGITLLLLGTISCTSSQPTPAPAAASFAPQTCRTHLLRPIACRKAHRAEAHKVRRRLDERR
jgi:hypothetical protein